MKQMLNDKEMEQVVGGTVRLNLTRMRIGFTYLGEAFDLVGCTSDEATDLALDYYKQYKNAGDKALEEATKAAFAERGWIA